MPENAWFNFVIMPLLAYLVGSTPFAVLLARSRGVNLREVGSGNVGATNLARALGRPWGYACFLLDLLKGLVPVLVVGLLLRTGGDHPSGQQQAAWLLVGCGAIIGHVFPFWLRFRGGKGVSTALGVVLGIWPYFTLAGLAALGIWIVATLVSRYVSLGSIVAAAAFVPAFLAIAAIEDWPVRQLWPLVAFASAMVALIIVRHRTNIKRLLTGTENKISGGAKTEPGNTGTSAS